LQLDRLFYKTQASSSRARFGVTFVCCDMPMQYPHGPDSLPSSPARARNHLKRTTDAHGQGARREHANRLTPAAIAKSLAVRQDNLRTNQPEIKPRGSEGCCTRRDTRCSRCTGVEPGRLPYEEESWYLPHVRATAVTRRVAWA
jgi:hypothetical protein